MATYTEDQIRNVYLPLNINRRVPDNRNIITVQRPNNAINLMLWLEDAITLLDLGVVLSANNGLEVNGTVIQLGGDLIQNTTINGLGETFNINHLSGSSTTSLETSPTYITREANNGINNLAENFTPSIYSLIETSGTDIASIVLSNATVGLTNSDGTTTTQIEARVDNALISSDSVYIDGVFRTNISRKLSDYTIVPRDHIIVADAVVSNVTITLPATPLIGDQYYIKASNIDNGSSLDGNGNTIDGVSNINFSVRYQSVKVVYDGVEWNII